VDFEAVTTVARPYPRVFEAVADLDTYPHWFTIVARAVAAPADEPTWDVDLAARFGPLGYTKRVRMVQVHASVDDGHVRYERQETDGRPHSAWVLDAQVAPAAGAAADGPTDVRVRLHYDGIAWLPGLDLLLRQEAKRAGARLAAYLA
jgi:hypothetical protein